MRVLLDTHALLWALSGNTKLSPAASDVIADAATDVLVSAASAMEVTTKYRLGKLPEAAMLAAEFLQTIKAADYTPLPLLVEHAALAGSLDVAHGDPFDRFLVAQALFEDMPIVSNEKLLISMEHASLAGSLDIAHKDPFDRLLIAQARTERVPIVSNEKLFDACGVERIW